jgi:gliding motility-associated-like protein
MIVNCTRDLAGFYVLGITLHGCSGKDSVYIRVDSLPVFDIADTVVCTEEAILLEAPQGFQNYWWSNGATSSSIIITEPGNFVLNIADIHNCRASDTIYVSRKECEIPIPNVFTPNEDQMNDFFEFPFVDTRDVKMIIYDRWGKIIKRLSGESVRWDGTNESGKRVLSGTYYWLAELINIAGTQRSYKGFVELIDH